MNIKCLFGFHDISWVWHTRGICKREGCNESAVRTFCPCPVEECVGKPPNNGQMTEEWIQGWKDWSARKRYEARKRAEELARVCNKCGHAGGYRYGICWDCESKELEAEFRKYKAWKPELETWRAGFIRMMNQVHDNPLYFTERGPVRKCDLPRGLEDELHKLFKTISEKRLAMQAEVDMEVSCIIKKYDLG